MCRVRLRRHLQPVSYCAARRSIAKQRPDPVSAIQDPLRLQLTTGWLAQGKEYGALVTSREMRAVARRWHRLLRAAILHCHANLYVESWAMIEISYVAGSAEKIN